MSVFHKLNWPRTIIQRTSGDKFCFNGQLCFRSQGHRGNYSPMVAPSLYLWYNENLIYLLISRHVLSCIRSISACISQEEKRKNNSYLSAYHAFLLITLNFIPNLPQTFWLVVSNMCSTSIQMHNWFLLAFPWSCVLEATKTSYGKPTSYRLRYMVLLISFLMQF